MRAKELKRMVAEARAEGLWLTRRNANTRFVYFPGEVEKEIQKAAGVAMNLSDDRVAARMAFLETYRQAPTNISPGWFISEGWDKEGREGPVLEAVRLGRLAADVAVVAFPESEEAKLLAEQKKDVSVGPALVKSA